MKARYRLSHGVRYRKESFGGLLFYPKRFLTLELNETAFEMLPLLESGTSLAEICDEFGWEKKEPQLIVDFLSEFAKSGVIEEVS